jgi:hypothetical protein
MSISSQKLRNDLVYQGFSNASAIKLPLNQFWKICPANGKIK